MADRPVESTVILIDSRYTEAERLRIGRRMVGFIHSRTKKGQGVGGKTFVSADGINIYTEGYSKTKEFKAFGKKRSPINLKLTGNMNESLVLLDHKVPGRIKIGFKGTGNANNKAAWMREKGYNFVGLSSDETAKILKEFKPPGSGGNQVVDLVSGLAESLLKGLN